MQEKAKGVQIQQKIKVGDSLISALPYNTADEVYYDIDRNVMLSGKLLNIDMDTENVETSNTEIKNKLNTAESNLSEIETNIGDGGGLSQKINTIKSEITLADNSLINLETEISSSNARLDEITPAIDEHKELSINSLEGVHGLRFNGDELSYKDIESGLWNPISIAQNDIDLIKHALSGKISTNQFILKKNNCRIESGCYRNGYYFINEPSYTNPAHYRTMTVKVDLSNNDPETSITYHDDAKNMIPGSILWDDFFGHYPCLFKDGEEVGVLQKNDFTKFLNGSSADITTGTSGDVMIAFPKRGLRMNIEGNILVISMTDNPNDPDFSYIAHTRNGSTIKDAFYWGAYKGVLLSDKLRSLSGHTPSGNISAITARTHAQANGEGYEISPFYPLNYLISAYLLKYKSRDSQTKVGQGYTNPTNTSQLKTGGTETLGMDWGERSGEFHVKVLGIEDFWGNLRESIDGLTITSEGNVLTSTGPFSDATDNYTDHGQHFSSNSSGIISKFIGTNELGFIPSEFLGAVGTHFCDQGSVSKGNNGFHGGGWNDGANAGVFMMGIENSPTSESSVLGARLTYI